MKIGSRATLENKVGAKTKVFSNTSSSIWNNRRRIK